jgi:hypothetical protein
MLAGLFGMPARRRAREQAAKPRPAVPRPAVPRPAAPRPAGPRAGLARRREDSGSMPMALLVTLVGVSLSALLSNLVVGQIQSTRVSAARTSAVNAAQAGLDVALAAIKNAYNASGGLIAKLPCGPLSGTVDPANATDMSRYVVTIDYFLVDPSGYQDDITPILSSRVACAAASGTGAVPAFALLRANGTATGDKDHNGVLDVDAAWRSLYATYTFSTETENIPGGMIRVVNAPSSQCLGGARSPMPIAADPVKIIDCASSPLQTFWQYPKNMTLVLRNSHTAATPNGLCATAASQGDSVAVTFQKCKVPTDFHQQWRYAADQWVYNGTADGLTDSGYCFNVKNPGVLGSDVYLKNGASCGSPFQSSRTFSPDPSVGSGAAGPDTGQLVNKKEVGRCLDVPRDDVYGTVFTDAGRTRALITYPCKQAFDGNVHWNHKWSMPAVPAGAYKATGHISVTPGDADDNGYNLPFCLKSPGAGGGEVWLKDCTVGGTILDWTLYLRAPLDEDAYQIEDANGNCLQSIGPTATAAQRLDAWSEVFALPCDGSELQKWNVPGTFSAGPLKSFGEK